MQVENNIEHPIIRASKEKDLKTFMEILFPKNWYSIIGRIIESGAKFDDGNCKWAPRWSNIPWTVKGGKTELEASLKSCMYRVHDCFHQLWGLPIPTENFSTNDFYSFKRAQMCGEVAVLTLCEFVFANHLYNTYPELQSLIDKRCSVPMLKSVLSNKTPQEIATRLDGMLHKKSKPRWVREDKASSAFYDYYVPMLEDDRKAIDINWEAMVQENWIPSSAPNSRYSSDLDGLELTLWMINDFFHLLKTDEHIDYELSKFNMARRSNIVLPSGWN